MTILNGETKLPDKYEIIVVDNGEEPALNYVGDMCGDRVQVIKSPLHSNAKARNTGARHANYDLLCFLDDDILPSPYYFMRHVEVHERWGPCLCYTKRRYPDEIITWANSFSFGRYKLRKDYTAFEKPILNNKLDEGLYLVYGFAAYSMSIERDVYMGHGGFNESFTWTGCEDAEFAYRFLKNGGKIIYDDNNICYHNEWDCFSLVWWARRHHTGSRSTVVMCYLHPEGKEHPNFKYNAPFSVGDTLPTILQKLKRRFLSFAPVYAFLMFLGKLLEKRKGMLWDIIAFRVYSALWIASHYRGFREEYKKWFGAKTPGINVYGFTNRKTEK